MGTYITPGNTKEQTVAEIVREYGPFKDQEAVGRCFWVVFQVSGDEVAPSPVDVIGLFLLTDGGSGYKPMDETMGPYYHGVPQRMIDTVPDPKLGFSTGWRERVKRYQAGAREIDLR